MTAPTVAKIIGEAVIHVLRRRAFAFTTEAELQAGIGRALSVAGVTFEAEAIIADGDRIDFRCGALGIEVKIGGSPNAVIRQLHRYAQADGIDALLLVTSRMKLARAMPAELNGKAILTYHMAGDAL